MKPLLIEKYADNGEHSHWELINSEDGSILWEQPEEDDNLPKQEGPNGERLDCGYFKLKPYPDSCGDCQTDGHYLCGNCKHIACFEDMELSDNRERYYPELQAQKVIEEEEQEKAFYMEESRDQPHLYL